VLNRRVAIKMMAPPEPGALETPEIDEERFLREAQVSANLAKHPHIVSVYEAGIIEGKRFLAMEFVEGQQLQDWRRGVPIRDQIAVLRDVALAVHHANENGVVHRDLKPANVIVDGRNRPHVTDFGLAKALAPEFSRSITTSGLIVGTPAYMSPEQAQGLRGVDGRSDVYSLGVMLYEVLTDQPPFEAETAMQLLIKVVEHPAPKPSSVVKTEGHPARNPRLEGLCLRALAKLPKDRPATAREFAEELSRWLADTGASGLLVQHDRPRRAPAGSLVVAGVAVLLLCSAVAAFLLRSGRPPAGSTGREHPVLEGHTDRVLSVAFSPRGDRLASGSSDHTIRLWDPVRGTLLATFGPHAGKVEAIAFSPDGSLIASVTEAGDDRPGEVKLWDVSTGTVRSDLKGHEVGVNCVAFSPDGALLATGDRAGTVRLWEVAGGRAKGTIPNAHESSVRGLAFTPDGLSLVTGSWDHEAKLWEVTTQRERRAFRGHSEGLWGLAVSPDGTLLATASSDRTVRLWDLASGTPRRTIPAHTKEASSVAFSPDGKRLASGGWDRRVRLWDPASGAEVASFPGHDEAVWSVAFSPDGRLLASGGLDRKVRLWKLP
ncbi:MAG TPA: serine/threonine-protein kinase, partial [Planctomycetota bacterium]|nr:serine/threonine-protein kinase [Planctomycetota bacterium]